MSIAVHGFLEYVLQFYKLHSLLSDNLENELAVSFTQRTYDLKSFQCF